VSALCLVLGSLFMLLSQRVFLVLSPCVPVLPSLLRLLVSRLRLSLVPGFLRFTPGSDQVPHLGLVSVCSQAPGYVLFDVFRLCLVPCLCLFSFQALIHAPVPVSLLILVPGPVLSPS
jgi:hypothetical protein